jgi:hypothetical protein
MPQLRGNEPILGLNKHQFIRDFKRERVHRNKNRRLQHRLCIGCRNTGEHYDRKYMGNIRKDYYDSFIGRNRIV